MVTEITKSAKLLRLQSNGGTMLVHHKAKLEGYCNDVWFSDKAIADIIAFKNLRKQYHITYDSRISDAFTVHRQCVNKPDMLFRMHESGLHDYDPSDDSYVFVNTVSENKEGFSQRQIKGAEAARALYARVGYPSTKDFKWVIQSNLIQDCPVTVADIDVARQIWGKNIAA